jgi:hypothetical protein
MCNLGGVSVSSLANSGQRNLADVFTSDELICANTNSVILVSFTLMGPRRQVLATLPNFAVNTPLEISLFFSVTTIGR